MILLFMSMILLSQISSYLLSRGKHSYSLKVENAVPRHGWTRGTSLEVLQQRLIGYGRYSLRLEMSKADKEKKKKKAADVLKSKQTAPTETATQTTSKPWRVSSDTFVKIGDKSKRIPVKVQIAWAKAYKRLQAKENDKGVTKRWRQENVRNLTVEEYTEIDYQNTQPPGEKNFSFNPNLI